MKDPREKMSVDITNRASDHMFCLVKEKQHTHSDINSQDKASRTYSSIVIILLVYSKELSAYTVISEGETANDENIRRLLRVISF